MANPKDWRDLLALLLPTPSTVELVVRLLATVVHRKSNEVLNEIPEWASRELTTVSRTVRIPHPAVTNALLALNRPGLLPQPGQDFSNEPFVITQDLPLWAKDFVVLLNQSMSEQRLEANLALCRAPKPGQLQAISAALTALEQASPRTHRLVDAMVRRIVVLSGTGFVGASSKVYLGVVAWGGKANDTVVQCIDTLVHEASHIDLYIRQMFDPMLSAPESLLPSPFRSLPRPAEGVFHACFVLSRVCLALSDVVRCHATVHLAPDAAALLARNLTLLDESLHSLSSFPGLTTAGSRLLKEMQQVESSLAATSKAAERSTLSREKVER